MVKKGHTLPDCLQCCCVFKPFYIYIYQRNPSQHLRVFHSLHHKSIFQLQSITAVKIFLLDWCIKKGHEWLDLEIKTHIGTSAPGKFLTSWAPLNPQSLFFILMCACSWRGEGTSVHSHNCNLGDTSAKDKQIKATLGHFIKTCQPPCGQKQTESQLSSRSETSCLLGKETTEKLNIPQNTYIFSGSSLESRQDSC